MPCVPEAGRPVPGDRETGAERRSLQNAPESIETPRGPRGRALGRSGRRRAARGLRKRLSASTPQLPAAAPKVPNLPPEPRCLTRVKTTGQNDRSNWPNDRRPIGHNGPRPIGHVWRSFLSRGTPRRAAPHPSRRPTTQRPAAQPTRPTSRDNGRRTVRDRNPRSTALRPRCLQTVRRESAPSTAPASPPAPNGASASPPPLHRCAASGETGRSGKLTLWYRREQKGTTDQTPHLGRAKATRCSRPSSTLGRRETGSNLTVPVATMGAWLGSMHDGA
jgi:hypothetical protein